MFSGKESVSVRSVTWKREESEGLFDYSKRNCLSSSIAVTAPTTLVRVGNNVKPIHRQKESEEGTALGKVELIGGHWCVSPMSQPGEKMWLVVDSIETKEYRLSKGDVIRLGRVKFRIKELNASSKEPTTMVDLDEYIHNYEEDEEESDNDEDVKFNLPCRVCLSDKHNTENPLISPCKCQGTMKYIHLECLQKYLKSKMRARSSDICIALTWRVMKCDLCFKQFPYSIKVDDKIVKLIELPKPSGNYIILEALSKSKEDDKSIHIVSFHSKLRVKLGRNNDADVRFVDVSVSRNHAVIKRRLGGFYILDTESKFGTLVQVKRPIPLENYSPISLQTGKTVMTLSYKKPWNFFPSCFRSQSTPFDNKTLFPVSTGISLSIGNLEQLKMLSGIIISNDNDNLLFKHHQVGINSSCEDDDAPDLEDVEVADIFEQHTIDMKTSFS